MKKASKFRVGDRKDFTREGFIRLKIISKGKDYVDVQRLDGIKVRIWSFGAGYKKLKKLEKGWYQIPREYFRIR